MFMKEIKISQIQKILMSLCFCPNNAIHEMLWNIDEFMDMNGIKAEFQEISAYFLDTFYGFWDENNIFSR